MFGGSFTIGTIRGIAIRVHWSWIIIVGLVTWSLAEGYYPEVAEDWSEEADWGAAVASALALFASVFVHELSHAVVAQRNGLHVPSITLFIFGGVSQIEEEARTAGLEFRIAIAGPLASWALAGLFAAIGAATVGTAVDPVFWYLAIINGALGLFNLLPGFPLDGGRVLRAVLWHRHGDRVRATRSAASAGSMVAYVLMAYGVISIFALGLLGGIWFVLIGLFLKNAADASLQETVLRASLGALTARDVMREAPPPVAPETSLERVVQEWMLDGGERVVLVAGHDSTVAGLLTVRDLAKHPRDSWPRTDVQSAMVPAAQVHTVAPDTPVTDCLRELQEHDIHQLPVIEDGRLAGLVTRADLLRWVEVRTAVGGDDSRRS